MVDLGPLIYEGKSKKIFASPRPGEVIQEFKDDITAGNNVKKDKLPGKGELNNRISTLIFQCLIKAGVPTHFVEALPPVHMRVKKLSILPVEVIVRNKIAGSAAKRLGISEGTALETPILYFHLKSDPLGDPLVTEDELAVLKYCSREDIAQVKRITETINKRLCELFRRAGIELIDFKLEFGRDHDGRLFLADEISPDSCRLWDAKTQEKMDKDRFRRDLGDVVSFYREVLKRLEASS